MDISFFVMRKIKLMSFLFLLLLPLLSYAQTTPATSTPAQAATTPEADSKIKNADIIFPHWVTTYGMSGEEFVKDQRDSFKTAAFAEVYIECIIDDDSWLFNLLNRITKLRNEENHSPYVFLELKFKPKDATLTSYTIPTFTLKASTSIRGLDKIAIDAHTKYLKGKIYTEPFSPAVGVVTIPQVTLAFWWSSTIKRDERG